MHRNDDTLDVARLDACPLIRKLTYAPTLASTNDAAREEIARRPLAVDETPWLIVAETQTRGRGRGGNAWWSAAGALTFTLVLRGELAALRSEHWPRISLTAALAVIAAVERAAPLVELELRWPNDVYARGGKLCGILPEVIGPPGMAWLVLGIGLNVNNAATAAPDDVRRRATSLIELTGQPHDRTSLLIGILGELLAQLGRLTAGDPRLAADWDARCYLRGRRVRIEQPGGAVEGRVQGIDPAGRLIVDTASGTVAASTGTLSVVE